MKPKLTKAQKAKAKRAVVADLELVGDFPFVGTAGTTEVWRSDPERPEVERLLRVALKAVRGA